MFNLIQSIISHSWIDHGEFIDPSQDYTYYICGALIIIFTVVFIDLFYRLVRGLLNRGKFD